MKYFNYPSRTGQQNPPTPTDIWLLSSVEKDIISIHFRSNDSAGAAVFVGFSSDQQRWKIRSFISNNWYQSNPSVSTDDSTSSSVSVQAELNIFPQSPLNVNSINFKLDLWLSFNLCPLTPDRNARVHGSRNVRGEVRRSRGRLRFWNVHPGDGHLRVSVLWVPKRRPDLPQSHQCE